MFFLMGFVLLSPGSVEAPTAEAEVSPLDETVEDITPIEVAEPPATPLVPGQQMDNRRLGELIELHFEGLRIEGGQGVWRVQLPEPPPEADQAEANGEAPRPDEQQEPEQEPEPAAGPGADKHLPPIVLILTDERADRMRIMMPIRPFDPEQVEDLRLALIALHANYDRALDARYALQDGVLWSVFIHPLGSLTEDGFANALRQVQSLRQNTGTTYSSSGLLFGPQVAPEATEPNDDSPQA